MPVIGVGIIYFRTATGTLMTIAPVSVPVITVSLLNIRVVTVARFEWPGPPHWANIFYS
jgi:hypothetical protein